MSDPITIRCNCCHERKTFDTIPSATFALASMYADVPNGVMCAGCCEMVGTDPEFKTAAEQSKARREEAWTKAVKRVQESHNFKPTEIKSIH